jgi:hypothetical protein
MSGGGCWTQNCENVTKKITRMLKNRREKNTAKSQNYFLSLYWVKKMLSYNSRRTRARSFPTILSTISASDSVPVLLFGVNLVVVDTIESQHFAKKQKLTTQQM